MKKIVFLFCCLLVTGYNLCAEDLLHEVMERINYVKNTGDHSDLYISAGSDNQPIENRKTKVQFIMIDSQDRKTGFKSIYVFESGDTGVKSYHEIPNSAYSVEQICSLDPNDPCEPESAVLNFFPPVLKDTYTLQFIGFDDCKYSGGMYLGYRDGSTSNSITFRAYISSGAIQEYHLSIDPAPGAPPPVLKKEVTFRLLKEDIEVAYKLGHLGGKKFKDELIKIIDRAEKLLLKCEKKEKNKDKCGNRKAAINQLKSLIKRMEQALKKGEKKKEDKGKKFIVEEAFKIIKGDAETMIDDLGGEIGKGKK